MCTEGSTEEEIASDYWYVCWDCDKGYYDTREFFIPVICPDCWEENNPGVPY